MKDFAELIGTWPAAPGRTSIGTFAADIGVSYIHACTMKQRNSVADIHWDAVVQAAAKRGVPVSYEMLAKMKAKPKAKPKSKSKAACARPTRRAPARAAA
ncbi:MAG TPA: hypothetical protein VNK48_14485 [Xanthobacteraceae bacterium]|nr:hypothetical protein [Xanthobacteraceae bacterium]